MSAAGCSHFLSSLQVDVAHLRPDAGVDILPNALMSKCAALSVRPDAVADLVKCMRCKYGQLSPDILAVYLNSVTGMSLLCLDVTRSIGREGGEYPGTSTVVSTITLLVLVLSEYEYSGNKYFISDDIQVMSTSLSVLTQVLMKVFV